MSQEAFVGILYVVATAATILVVDRAPQGAEHVKKILIGNILTVGPAALVKFAALYAAIGLFHWLARKPLLAISGETDVGSRSTLAVSLWDFAFFLSFGIVVTSSVTTAGVLLVFSFLIVPAVIGSLFSRKLAIVLPIAWGGGIVASAAGLAGSYVLDLPTGAAMVAAFAVLLVLAGLARALIFLDPTRRRANWAIAARAAAALVLLLTVFSSLWLILNPAADQPLAALIEGATGIGPAQYLGTHERELYVEAVHDMGRFQAEVDRLNAGERAARYQGAPLSDDAIRRISSYQQSFSEMTRGERFVQDVLRAKARARERWIFGLPLALAALAALAWMARPSWRMLIRSPDGAPRSGA